MGKYGEIAIKSVQLIRDGKLKNPIEAWEIASCEIFGKGTSSQEKVCPKCAFLGLCEEGKVIGIVPGKYTTSIKNKRYVLRALEFIKKDKNLINNKNNLWKKITDKQEEGQLDIVLSLYNKNLLKI